MRLTTALKTNAALWEALHRFPALGLPGWYVGAGCVAQTVWNIAHRKRPDTDILDCDLVYFERDLSEERECVVTTRARALVADLPLALDVKNQARVHLWYARRLGYEILPYRSTEDAIATWPTTATAIGVRPHGGVLEAWAPFGTTDLFDLVIRPNRVQITPAIYDAKVARWIRCWPSLVVLRWDEGVGEPGSRHSRGESRDE